MNKQRVLILLFLGCINAAFSQRGSVENLPNFDKPDVHYGFYLGINQNDFKVSYKPSGIENPEVIVHPEIGFNVGLIADVRISNRFNFRFEPGLSSNAKTIAFRHITSSPDSLRSINSTYLHMPLILKMSADRYYNVKPYILAGISYNHNFSSNQKNNDDNYAGEWRMKSDLFMYEVGVGIDIYLTYFKLSPSIRGVFALDNEIKYDNTSGSPWTDPVKFMGTRGIFLNLAFE